MEKKNGNFGYQPDKKEEKGYQPINPGNGYQPTTLSTDPKTQTPPPSTDSSVKKD